jgi:hypothetical protein
MPALTKDRNTPAWGGGGRRQGAVAASTLIFAGAMLMRDASGNILEGQTDTGLTGVGRALERVDNSSGSAGDLTVDYDEGIFRFANSAAADEITKADIGNLCYAVDDQTVAKTDGSSSRSKAGIVADVDAQGVWVRFDEALTKAR